MIAFVTHAPWLILPTTPNMPARRHLLGLSFAPIPRALSNVVFLVAATILPSQVNADGLMRHRVLAKESTVVARESPNSKSAIMFRLVPGLSYTVVEKEGDWHKLAGNAWVHADGIILRSEALQFFSSQLRDAPTPFAYCSRGAVYYYQPGSEPSAVRDFDDAIRANPGYVPAYCFRGAARIDTKDLKAARRDLELAIKLDPKFDLAWMYLGHLSVAEGEYGEAQRAYDAAINCNSYLPIHFINRASFRLARGPIHLAIRDLDQARILDERNARIYEKRGVYWELVGDFDRALQDYEHAIELQPNLIDAIEAKARQLYGRNRFQEALKLCDAALKKKGDTYGLVVMRGYSLAAIGKYSEALTAFESLEKMNSDKADHQIGIGAIRASCPLKEYRDAGKSLAAALLACERRSWRDAEALATLAAAYAEAADYASAVSHQQGSIELLAIGSHYRTVAEKRLDQYRQHQPLRQAAPGWR